MSQSSSPAELRRSINLPLLVLYGLGTMIGAGIYVLVGAAAGRAGIYAPVAFIFAAIALAPTAASYGELAGRFPVSAGEAAYAKHGFRSTAMSALLGWMVIFSGIIASAAITIGCVGYIRTFFDVPAEWLVVGVVFVLGMVAAWGILESVLVAALFTLVEAGGLLFLIWAGFVGDIDLVARIPETIPPLDEFPIWLGIANAGLLAVFAFIGFEDMVNVAEETKAPGSTLPAAILITLAITTLLYTGVTVVAVLAVPPQELAVAEAPLSLVFEQLTGTPPIVISAIAIFATMNTVLVQLIMASRVVYGMARQKTMPAILARVEPKTQTPVLATFIICLVVLLLALYFPLEKLAEFTSQIVLAIWALVNAALIALKHRDQNAPSKGFTVQLWVPYAGFAFSFLLIVTSFIAA